MYGGDFIIVNEGLNDEFDRFKRKVISYLDDALRMVRSIDLLNFLDQGKQCLSAVTSGT